MGVKGTFNQWKEISMRWWNEEQAKLKSIGIACHKKNKLSSHRICQVLTEASSVSCVRDEVRSS